MTKRLDLEQAKELAKLWPEKYALVPMTKGYELCDKGYVRQFFPDSGMVRTTLDSNFILCQSFGYELWVEPSLHTDEGEACAWEWHAAPKNGGQWLSGPIPQGEPDTQLAASDAGTAEVVRRAIEERKR